MRLGLGQSLNTSHDIVYRFLDIYPNAVGAYSTRKLSHSYTGYALTVRETASGNNWEADIGFQSDGTVGANSPIFNATGAPADATTLSDFANSGDLHVKTWFDQTGGTNATKGTASEQPKIMSSGTLVTQGSNNQAALDFDGSDDELQIADSDAFSFTDGSGTDKPISMFITYDLEETTNGRTIISKDEGGSAREWTWYFDGSDQRFYLKSGGGGNQQSYDGDNVGTGLQVGTMLYTGSESYTGIQFYKNGSAASMVDGQNQTYSGMSNTSAPVRISNRYTGSSLNSKISEIIVYDTAQATNRTAIETNINNHFGVY